MKKNTRVITIALLDIVFINIAFLSSLYLHNEGTVSWNFIIQYMELMIFLIPIKLILFRYFSLYNSLWAYASIEELMKVVVAILIGNAISIAYMVARQLPVYFGVYLNSIFFEIALIGGGRFSYRLFRRIKHHKNIFKQKYPKNVLIVGTGSTASLVAKEIKNHPDAYGHIIGYIDDDHHKRGKTIAGVKVLGNQYEIYGISKRYHVDEIILAVPTLKKEAVKAILEESKRTGAKVRIMPGIMEIIDGKVSMKKIRDVEIEDLLGRAPVDLNVHMIASYIENKVVMVTGGGGSIGSELCKQIARFNPSKLIILDIYENNAYHIQNELKRLYQGKINVDVLIASVRDRENIFDIMASRRPQVIFHAAAHKHVPLMEHVPKEAIKNNVFGTLNVAEAADQNGVERFVLISTDKAVNSTNIMGASKRMCEMIIQALAKTSATKFTAVRFGNVLGSNGSVIPLFKKQIAEGGPVTITHKDIIRYFMTIPEAAQLVIQAGAFANGSEIFVLDMGEPVKIYNLAEDLIKLSGLEPHENIKIEVIGLRPGEKLYEELLLSEEGLETTKHKKIFIGQTNDVSYTWLKNAIQELRKGIFSMDNHDFKELVKDIVPTYIGDQRAEYEKEEGEEIVEEYLRNCPIAKEA